MTKLTNEETHLLCLLAQKQPNSIEGQRALDQLVRAHTPLVHFLLKQTQKNTNHLKYDDLIQEGTIGLIVAIRKYNSDKANFSTYAGYWIKQHIQRAIQNQEHTIAVPSYLQDHKKSNLTGIPKGIIGDYTPEFLDSLIYNNNKNDTDYLSEIIVNGSNIEDAQELLKNLTPKQRNIILRSFGVFSGEEETLQSIADSYECSKQCIWEMREKAIVKLRQMNPNVFIDVKLEHYKSTKNVLTVTEAKKIVAMRETMSFRDMAQELGLASVGGASHKYTAAKKILEQHPQ